MKAVPERIVVLVEHDVGGSAVLRCKTVALSRERDAVVRAAIDAAMSVSEDGSRWRADVTWRRVDVASVGLSPRESDAHERLALPGRAFASLDTIDLGGVALPLATADGASSRDNRVRVSKVRVILGRSELASGQLHLIMTRGTLRAHALISYVCFFCFHA